ncbi:MAG: GspE/PulE family protein [Thermoguttaceae bacterium]
MPSASVPPVGVRPEQASGRVPASASRPLGELLVGARLITPDELAAALEKQSKSKLRLGEALIDLGFVSEEQILPFIQRQLNLPATRLREGMIDPRVVRLIPRAKAEAYHALAMFKVRDTLTVAMSDPQNLQQADDLERTTGLKIRPVFATRAGIQRMIPRCYEDGFQVDTVTADLDENAVELQPDAVEVELDSVESLVDGSPIINLVNYFILQAIRQGASDIHIEPSRHYSVVRFRVDGLLREVLRPRRDIHPAIVSRIKVMAKMDIAEHRLPQDGRFHVAVEGREIDLRVSTLPTVLGEKVVLRVLDRRRVTFNLDTLGIPPDMLAQLKQLLAKPYGLLLVTGPTGSGKTTTLYSALELIKSIHRNIVTVEDPVEYQLELINQVQVDQAASLEFATVLRSILRQDPDVIMVGEIRDVPTAEVAVQAALTGHLVLSTLHTNDSAGAITRLIDMGIAPYKVAASLVGVVAQRLVRTLCPHCRTNYYPPTELLEGIRYQGDPRRSFARGEGCPKCHDTGFQGRTGIYEVLIATPEFRELIMHECSLDRIRQWYRQNGGRTLFEEGIRLAEKELTSLDEVMRVAFFE